MTMKRFDHVIDDDTFSPNNTIRFDGSIPIEK
jgi:hypothetical protein